MTGFTKFPSIESFAHVYKGQQYFDTPATVMYGAKIKLHGINAAVRVSSGGAVPATVVAQSRSRDITTADDKAGFAKWVEDTTDAWLLTSVEGAPDVTFFGEWAGKGIQKGDAVTKLDGKYFFVFAAQIGDQYITTPHDLEEMIPDLDNVLVLPWDIIFEKPVDFSEADECQSFADILNERVKTVAMRDPFIYGIFGVEGPGEGWVLSPVVNPGEDPLEGELTRDWYSALTFKVKVEGHSVKKGKSASREIEVPEGVPEFVDMFVTEARCAQGLQEACDGIAEPARTGAFLKWLGQDVKKESVAELEDSDLEWKHVSKHVTTAARMWWLAQCEKI